MKHDSIIAQEGYPFIIFFLIITVFVAFLGICWLLILSALISFFTIWFFRNPERHFQEEEKVVISPADGKVIKVEDIKMEGSMAGKFQKISIFMNVFNVHVNRIPYNGKIEAINYSAGKFVSANLDKASSDNERNAIKILTENGSSIWAVQIAGLIARRIVCWVKKGDTVKKGERFGLIRFGSRVDVYLPENSRIAVKIGQKVRAGESPLGYLP
jgi:phosphatidylserine decarboxylase